MNRSETNKDSAWQKTPYANLIRYVPSGNYFARLRVRGKLIRRGLKTSRLSVATMRLADLQKEERRKAERRKAGPQSGVAGGVMTFADAQTAYLQRLMADVSLKPSSKVYRQERIKALAKSWPALEKTDVCRISRQACLSWAAAFAQTAAPSSFNNTVGTLRLILETAVEAGAIYDNPARFIKRLRVRAKDLRLPKHDEFLSMVAAIEASDGGWNHRCADLVRFLSFGGFRKSEAAAVTWADCDLEKGEIVVRGDPVTGTKNWSIRRVPMIPEMKALLVRLQTARPHEPTTAAVMQVRECQGAINSACRKLGIQRITHHDLRHLFATRCIESAVDIPTVSRWLGHKDGGALAMKVYGHLRDQHSTTMARLVSFSGNPATTPAPRS